MSPRQVFQILTHTHTHTPWTRKIMKCTSGEIWPNNY